MLPNMPSSSWVEENNREPNNNGEESLSTFKSMLGEEDDWFLSATNTPHNIHHHHNHSSEINFPANFDQTPNNNNLLIDSSSSCSPSSASVFSHLDPSQVHFFLPQKLPHHLPHLENFDLGFETGFIDNNNNNSNNNNSGLILNRGGVFTGFNDLAPNHQLGNPTLNPSSQFHHTHLLNLTENTDFGSPGFQGFGENLLFNRSKLLKPLDNFASIGSQPTLFQKRAALRKNLNSGSNNNNGSGSGEGYNGKMELGEVVMDRKRKLSSGDDDLSLDGYDSEDFMEGNRIEENGRNGGSSSNNGNNNNSSVITGGGGGDNKGKKKGMPAKNLMAERRRRKKLNDRLYMLRSVVPKISKMDRASILGDAIEYLKELLQKINDLHNELESNPGSGSLTPTTTSFYPLTPTPPALASRIKEELCPSSLPSPTGQPARVEVRLREGRAVNIHMFCSRRPGLLLSTMKALDNLGLDIQQAVISCFNGFALDIFRAEQCGDGQDVHPDQIKAMLLDSAGLLA